MTTIPLSLKHLIPGQMKFMQNHGFEVHMASADGKDRNQVVEQEGVPHHIIPFTRRMTPIRDLITLGKCIHLMRSLRPDIVHTHTPKAGLIGMLAARWTGVPVRIHTLAGLPMKTATGWKKTLLNHTEYWTYEFATEVWPNNPVLKDYIVDRGLISADKCKVIGEGSSNGIDLIKWSPDEVDRKNLEPLKEQINYSEKNTYFLFVGRFVRDKGLEELVRAFVHLNRVDESLQLILAGTYGQRRNTELLSDECIGLIEELSCIHTVGWSDHVREWMSLADALIFPSHREGFPNVLLQAGAMKLPVLCSDIPEHDVLIEGGKSGSRFQVGDVSSIVDAVKWFLNHRMESRKMATRLNERVKKDFSREDMHSNILENYRRLLNKTPV